MTFALGIHPHYQDRLPTIADFLHLVIPHMWPTAYETNQSLASIKELGNVRPLN